MVRAWGLLAVVAALMGCDRLVSIVVDASLDVDPVKVATDFEATFGAAPPEGYKGGLGFSVQLFGKRTTFLSLIPENAAPEEIFEGGSSLKFNPGPHTMAVGVTLDLGRDDEEARRSFHRYLARSGEDEKIERIFLDVGAKRVAAYQGLATSYGQTNLVYEFLMDGGELVMVIGPEPGFDHDFKDAIAAALSRTHPANALLYSHLEAPTRDPNHPCGFRTLPDRFDVHAIGIHRGAEPLEGSAIDPRDDELYAQSVEVGRTEHPVVLVLMAQEPTVWRLSRTHDARLAGVLATGSSVQRVIGLPDDIPLREVTPRDPNGCDPFHADEDSWDRGGARDRIFDTFARDARRFHGRHAGGAFQVGTIDSKPASDPTRDLADVRLDPAERLLPGRLGLRQLIENGTIRPATPDDFERWIAAAGARRPAARKWEHFRDAMLRDVRMERGFVVERATRLPLGMAGAHSARFVVADGIADLEGDRGHNTILYADGRCVGPACP